MQKKWLWVLLGVVAALAIFLIVFTLMPVNLCEGIEDEEILKICLQLEEQYNMGDGYAKFVSLILGQKDRITTQIKLTDEAVSKADPNRCSQLEGTDFNACIIYAMRHVDDHEICEKYEDMELKGDAKTLKTMARVTSDMSLKDFCYLSRAVTYMDEILCGMIENGEDKESCYEKVEVKKEEHELPREFCNGDGFCDRASGESPVKCPEDCRDTVQAEICNDDGFCDTQKGESQELCPLDCPVDAGHPELEVCQVNGVCEEVLGETADNCPEDCG